MNMSAHYKYANNVTLPMNKCMQEAQLERFDMFMPGCQATLHLYHKAQFWARVSVCFKFSETTGLTDFTLSTVNH